MPDPERLERLPRSGSLSCGPLESQGETGAGPPAPWRNHGRYSTARRRPYAAGPLHTGVGLYVENRNPGERARRRPGTATELHPQT
jgi:hypothetical protein